AIARHSPHGIVNRPSQPRQSRRCRPCAGPAARRREAGGSRRNALRQKPQREHTLMNMPETLVPVHFDGIGGIGMNGIAEILHNQGYIVQGSDASLNPNVQRLRDMGITIHIGQSADNLGEAEVVVISSAIKKDNPELMAARARALPVVRRAEMLAEIMRFKNAIAIGGTHGKTTTTTLVATLLDAGELDPTVINGGIINAYGTNARLGGGDWMVVEADESDGTFVKLPADVA